MKYNIIITALTCLLFAACKKDVAIGPPESIEPDYTLPQGDASDEDNAKIQELYDQYGTYFLYNFTQKDFVWALYTSTGNSKIDTAVLGDTQYVGDMLQFLDDCWLKFIPEENKKSNWLPYRVFLADTIRQFRGPGYPPGYEYLYSDIKITGKSFAFAGMNASLRTMTPAEKRTKKNAYINAIWKYYQDNGLIEVPDSFFLFSDYNAPAPTPPVNASNPANQAAFRSMGFLPGSYTYGVSEWYYGTYSWARAKDSDISSFMLHILQRTDEEMAPYLTYPLIKEKFDFLVRFYREHYNIDVRAIANATF
ncbi:hypothetical protein COR50_19820 [Chitinophaga caeni]|uniref:Uncharacterized protein n=1 Tax=Chitinophaga caeni TaxID=2029983 RepID=A0A291QZA2_9BACT|nr:hypothetical protein [Chitinophaga caeni]ATL49241.1 hypothetical protein COR50_19820 [Chitinophaga caeni]